MRKFLSSILDIRETSDFKKTKSTISDGVSLRGYNLWILLCSSMLASIGLDTNSAAVIIGAMLISPLMSPILGVGLSVATHDKQLLLRSLRTLALSVAIALGTSVVYFIITPLGDITSELQARTFPTLLDVLIALFGGLAGIISISRHQATNAIPGVAIATAVMPPLCTAGFGIATLKWNYFLGAIYLFFINAVFISLATWLIVKYLHFPEKQFLNKKVERRYSFWFTLISIIVLLPSVYFLYTVYQKDAVKNEINNLVIQPINKSGNEIVKWEIQKRDNVSYVKLYYSGRSLSDSLKKAIDSSLQKHKMSEFKLSATRINLSREEIDQLSTERIHDMLDQMHLQEIQDTVKDKPTYEQVFKEVKIAFPFIDTLSNGWITIPVVNNNIDTLPVVFYKAVRNITRNEKKQLYNFLLVRFSSDSVILINNLKE